MRSTQNNARYYNIFLRNAHESFCAKILNMNRFDDSGADLWDKDKIAEVKFALIPYERRKRYPLAWTTLEYQMDYPNGKPGYWILGTYTLSCSFNELATTNTTRLEKKVTSRQIYIVDWNWMFQFPPKLTEGKTEKSEWKNTLRYPKLRKRPKTIISYEIEKGIVHITEGVPESVFNVQGSRMLIEPS